MSGIKVIDPEPDSCCRPSCLCKCFDFYPNDQRIRNINCPAFVIHGQMDDIIPFYHGHRLSEGTPKAQRWPGYFPRGAGHNDIVELNASAYFGEVGAFLCNVRERAGSSSSRSSFSSPVPGNGAVKKPAQIEMTETKCCSGSGGGVEEAEIDLPFAEPCVGPKDGRYQQWRRGHGGPKGSAQEMQVAG